MKTCKTCKEDKPLDSFTAQRTRKGTPTHSPYCRACRTEKGRRSRDDKLTSVCVCCGDTWRKVGGESRKGLNVCPVCYPAYRVAYQLNANAQHRSKSRGLDYDLDLQWVYERVKPMKCAVTGVDLSIEWNGSSYKDRNPYTPSIDKIDPTKGYTKDNVQIVCWWYNMAKSTHSEELVFKLCQALIANRPS